MNPAIRFVSNNAWAMVPPVFDGLVALVESHAQGLRADAAATGLLTDSGDRTEAVMQVLPDGTAVIPVRGVIARYADQLNGVCQDTGRSADSIQADLAAAMADPRVQRVALRIDSPGGTVAGTAETADAIRQCSAAGKPCHAFVDGLAASAAYWLASQCDTITASAATAQVGSIGVITAYVDASRSMEDRGYKLHVIRSTALKAPGTMNEALNAEQIASIQRTISDLHAAFATAVAAGRGLTTEQQAACTTGELYAADRAITLGLCDQVQGWDAFLAGLPAVDPDQITVRGQAVTTAITLSLTPAATTSATTKEQTMKVSIQEMAALLKSSAHHATLIGERAEAGDTADQIRAAIGQADQAKALADAQAAATAAQAAATAKDERIAALAAEVAELKGKLEAKGKVEALATSASRDPGHGQDETITESAFMKSDPATRAQIRAKGVRLVPDAN